MKISNAKQELQRMKLDMSHLGSEYNAIMTSIRALEEWNELLEEAGRVAIKDRDDLVKLIEKHIKRIEKIERG